MQSDEKRYNKTNLSDLRRTTRPVSELVGKLPPQAKDLEEVVLGALLIDREMNDTILDILRADYFYVPAHQDIFTAIHQLSSENGAIDLLTVSEQLKKMAKLEEIGGISYLISLTQKVASTANTEYHVRIIIEKYLMRQLILLSNETLKDAFEDTTDVLELLDGIESKLFELSDRNFRGTYAPIREVLKKALEEIREKGLNKDAFSGIPSGLVALDKLTAGWQKSDLIIIAARPGMGKTAFVLTAARNAAVDFKKAVAIFSLEMPSVQLVNRLIAGEAEIDSYLLRDGNLSTKDWEQLNTRINRISEAPIFIDETPAIGIFELRSKCRKLKKSHNIELIIIDYLQLMTFQSDKVGNREQEISGITRALKKLAKELNVPIIALSQLNRAVENRGSSNNTTGKPKLSDLRESGSIEQDADLVMFIYRPEKYQILQDEDGNSTKGLAEIIIEKHRHGATGSAKSLFVEKYTRFYDWDSQSFPPDYNHGQIEGLTYLGARPSIIRPSKMNDNDFPDIEESMP